MRSTAAGRNGGLGLVSCDILGLGHLGFVTVLQYGVEVKAQVSFARMPVADHNFSHPTRPNPLAHPVFFVHALVCDEVLLDRSPKP